MSEDNNRDSLIAAAKAALDNSYSPYSKFRVGAALRFADGTVVTGTNIENASYGLTLCAETVAVAKAMDDGHRGGLEEVAVIGDTPGAVSPCGRCRQVLNELADAAELFYIDIAPKAELLARHLTAEALPALADFIAGLADVAWEPVAIGALIKQSVSAHGLKMPKLAMPLRVLLTGQEQTPSVDALIALFPRELALERLAAAG